MVCGLLLLRLSGRGNVREVGLLVGFIYEIWGELSRGEVSGSLFFLRGDCPVGKYPGGTVQGGKLSGGNCPERGNCPGGNLPVHHRKHPYFYNRKWAKSPC